jgi:hypothetical protein
MAAACGTAATARNRARGKEGFIAQKGRDAGSGGEGAGEDPHCNAELRRAAERRGDDCGSDREATAMAAAARAARARGGGCEICGPRARAAL